jgi:hypothetical protein
VAHAVAEFVEPLRFNPEDHGFDARWVLDLSLSKSFLPHYGQEVDSASNRNEYQKFFLGVKTAGA